MGLLCCKYNNKQSKQKIVPTFRKHQHISFSILQLELSQYEESIANVKKNKQDYGSWRKKTGTRL